VRQFWRAGLASLVVVAAIAAGAVGVQRLYADRQFRRLLTAGEQALAGGDTKTAIESFSGALALRPSSMVAYLRRGEAYRKQGSTAEAARDWRQAAKLGPDAPQPFMALGDLYDAQGDFGTAAEWYGQADDRLKGQDPALLYRLALVRFKIGAPAQALKPLTEAVAKNDDSADAWYLLGLVQRDLGYLVAAIASLEAAIAIDSRFIAAREELADAYRAANRPVDELKQLQELAVLDPQSSRKVAIGLAEAEHGQLDGALGTLTRVHDSNPGDARLQLAIARVHLARAEQSKSPTDPAIARALDMLGRALRGAAPRSEGFALYGRALFLSGRHVESERVLREAVATSPVDPEAFMFLADAAESLRHDLLAREALMNLDVLEGDMASAETRARRATRIGELSLRAGDATTAVRVLSRAVDAGQTAPATLGLLAHAHWLAGDAESARTLLDRALAAAPRDPALQRLTRIIR
jgi:tetratricopeptide (TPR) repeat protein